MANPDKLGMCFKDSPSFLLLLLFFVEEVDLFGLFAVVGHFV